MTLQAAVEQYIECKAALGATFGAPAAALRNFSRTAGPACGCGGVTPEQAGKFLSRGGPNTRAWKHSILSGFYRYAIARRWAAVSPLPPVAPARVPPAPPYVYTREEVRRLLEATRTYAARVRQLEPDTFRALLLLLYGAGLRRGEALRLQRSAVDLPRGLIEVRAAKGGKRRLVPLCAALVRELAAYDRRKRPQGASAAERGAFFVNRDGSPLAASTVAWNFRKLCQAAGIRRDGAGCQPRLHDLRHAFATHRLEAWCREGRDPRRLLAALATCLGHASLQGTQVYLSMTTELLRRASLRFELYAQGAEELP